MLMILCQIVMKRCPNLFWKINIVTEVTEVLRSRNSQIRAAILRIKKTNTILIRPVKKLFPTENKYENTNQTDKAKGKKLRREAAVMSVKQMAGVGKT